MLHKLKVDLLQHSTTYLLFAMLGSGLIVAMLCGLFVLARLIVPGAQPTPTLLPTLTPSPTIASTLAAEAAYQCDQPPMPPVQPTTLQAASITATQIVAPIGRIGDPLPFLELPFPYDGGNENFGGTDAQFRRAMQRVGAGGRLNSFFDHLWPLYPSPKANWIRGLEPFESPAGGAMLLYDGTVNDRDYYSGHPGYDFMPFVRRTPTTPLFAAADGQVFDVGISGSKSAHYVKIKHHVVGIGDFLTIYWHLHPDQYFEAMRSRIGQPIRAGERIGTMGNTGWSTGHHLHFEVIFDRNADGRFAADERVDPFGFAPNTEYPIDPWGEARDFIDANGQPYHHASSISWYLWVHPLGSAVRVPANGGGQISLSASVGGAVEEAAACASNGSLPANGIVNWAQSPDPLPTNSMAGTGHSAALSVFDQDDRAVTRFDPPILIELPFEEADLKDIDPNTLIIYRAEANDDSWLPLPTHLDRVRRIASALTDRPGRFSLMGRPLRDLLAPRTLIQASGPTAPDGTFYDRVTITLSADDASGIQQIEYSLDGGSTWLVYNEPFVIEPNGLPLPITTTVDFEEGESGGPGRFVVLASATDRAGNVEEPPAFLGLVIDPSKGPTPTPTPTPTRTRRPPTRTFTPTPTRTPTRTPTPRVAFYASPPTVVIYGYCTTLYWAVDNVKSVKLDDQPVNGHGSRQVCPSARTTYVLRVKFYDDSVREYRVTVSEQTSTRPQVTFYASPNSIAPSQCSTLTWAVDNVKAVRLDGEGVNGHGTRTVCPTSTTIYRLRVKFNDDSITEFIATVAVNAYTDRTPPPAPVPLSPIDNMGIESYPALTWSAVTDPSGIQRYEWVLEEEQTSPTVAFVVIESGSTTAQTAAPGVNIRPHVNYRWRVRAVDGAKNVGAYSVYATFRGTIY